VALASDRWAHQSGIQGVPILRVETNSPAADAGLEGASRNAWGQIVLGDVIVGINKKVTANQDQLMSALENLKPGDRIEIHVVRQGKVLKRKLTLAAPRE